MKRVLSLKRNKDIAELVNYKQSVGNKYYVVYFKKLNDTKIAISISKKVGNAVVRNYQKRVVREIVSNNLELLQNNRILIVVKKNCLDIDFKEKEYMLKKLLLKVK